MNQNHQNKSGTLTRGLIAGIWISIVAAAMLVGAGFAVAIVGIRVPWSGDQLNDLGNFGSYLQGTTASLWSLAGVLLIVATFLAQQRQLKDQDRQFEIQNDSAKWQRFESSFFHLLDLHNEIVIALRHREPERMYPPRPQQFERRDCFEWWYENLHDAFYKQIVISGGGKDRSEPYSIETAADIAKIYLKFYNRHQGEIGHYFRNLYHLFKFVAESEIPDQEKRRYTSLARAQLSQYELALLFYNALTPIPPEKTNKFQKLIEDFGLLENLNRDLLVCKKRDEKFYSEEAFK